MRLAARHGFAFGLLWLACGSNSTVAQLGDRVNDSEDNVQDGGSHNNDDTTCLISSASAVHVPAIRLPATCRSGTVNYITHTLPRQCPTSTWSTPAHSNASSEGQDVTASSGAGAHENSEIKSSHGGQITTSSSEAVLERASTSDSLSATPITTQLDSSTATSVLSVSSSTTTSQPALTDAEAEAETDSLLDNANFLSFDDWKKQNLAKAGQSPDGGQGARAGNSRARPDIALDALGDEGEIELDFSGFGRSSPDKSRDDSKRPPTTTDTHEIASNTPILRSKDAGKTCKERSNYASFDCAATILKTNKEAKSASAILIENKDSYMLNPCSASNKFIIVELCDDILIDTLVLANYEFFSSIFRTFRVSVSDRYPVKLDRWKVLGTFEARSSRSVQAFLIEQPLIWARYLRIEFLTHFGTEYYCPVSLLRVHGTTMMEEFRHQEEVNRGEHLDDGEDEAEGESEVEIIGAGGEKVILQDTMQHGSPILSSEAEKTVVETAVPTVESSVEAAASEAQAISTSLAGPGSQSEHVDTTPQPSNSRSDPGQDSTSKSLQPIAQAEPTGPARSMNDDATTTAELSPSSAVTKRLSSAGSTLLEQASNLVSNASDTLADTPDSKITTLAQSTLSSSVTNMTGAVTSTSTLTSTAPKADKSKAAESTIVGSSASNVASSVPSSTISTISGTHPPASETSNTQSSSTASSSAPIEPSDQPRQAKQSAHAPIGQQPQHSQKAPSQPQKPSSSATIPSAPPNPSTQESFFKSVSTRLKFLEANATLSHQYIESQSLQLRAAFSQVEKRQLAKTSVFLSSLNATVLGELERVKNDYERLWEGVVIEIESLRRGNEREIGMVTERLSVIAEELVWQKRVGVVQSTFILLCLGFVIFAKSGLGSGGQGLDPLLQQLQLGRSRWGTLGTLRSPDSYSFGDRSPVSPPQSPSIPDGFDVTSPTSPESEHAGLGRDVWPGKKKPVDRRRRDLRWKSETSSPVGERSEDTGDSAAERPDTSDGGDSVVVNGTSNGHDYPSPSTNGSCDESFGGREKAQGVEGDTGSDSDARIYRSPELRFHSATPTPTGSPLRSSLLVSGIGNHEAIDGESDEDQVLAELKDGDLSGNEYTGEYTPEHDEQGTGQGDHDQDNGDEQDGEERGEVDQDAAEEEAEDWEGNEEWQGQLPIPKETQSSPSTPSGSRDMQGILGVVKEIPPWSPDGETHELQYDATDEDSRPLLKEIDEGRPATALGAP